MMALLETLNRGADYLAKHGIEDPRLNMEHLLAHVLKCRRLDLYLRFNEQLPEQDLAPLRVLLKRRGDGEPLQHLLGTVEFFGNELISDARALVPRPETEQLVEIIIRRLARDIMPPRRVLDMGAGGGCIGLSLALAWPQSEFTLADLSEDALELARLNAARLDLRPRFVRSDLFEKVTGEFDFVVANLPYVPRGDIASLDREVRRDPPAALDGGPDGMKIVRHFIEQCPAHLAKEGAIALELHHDQAPRATERLREAGFRDIATERDLAGIERFVFARAPEKVCDPVKDIEPTRGSD